MTSGKELKAIISIAGTIDPSLAKSISEATRQTSGLGTAFKVAGAVGVAGLASLGAAAVAGTKALMDLGTSFDSATDAIRIGTGATGEALEALQADFDEVYKSVPTTMEDASQAIADYNTRLGLTGPELQNISQQAIQVSNLLGDDLGGVIEESSQAFQQWGIDSKDMGDAMDYVFKASQSTGVGFTQLMSTVQQFGPQMQDMGFTFEETTALIGQLDKAGVNTTEVMSALKKSVTTMAKDGLTASEGLAQYTEQIRNAGTASEATAIAAEVFGSRAGSTMAAAIRNGTLSVTELTEELMKSDETIMKAAEDTMDFPERLQLLKQQTQVAFEPLANQIFDIANEVMPYLGEAMGEIAPMISEGIEQIMPVLSEMASGALPLIQDAIRQAMPFVRQIIGYASQNLPRVMGLMTNVASAAMSIIGPLISELMPVITGIIDVTMTFLDTAISSLLPPLAEMIESIIGLLPPILAALQPIMDMVLALLPIVMDALSQVLSALTPVVELVVGAISAIIEAAVPILQVILPTIVDQVGQVMAVMGPVVELVANTLVNALQNLYTVFQPIITDIFTILQELIDFVVNIFTGNWTEAWENVKNIFGSTFEALPELLKIPMNAVIAVINGAIEAINSLAIEIPDWVPVFGGEEFSLAIPQIPFLAKGGFTNGMSIAGEAGTEAVISFDPAVRDKNLSYWAKAGKMLGVNANAVDTIANSAKSGASGGGNQITFSPNVTIQGNADYDTVMQALRDNEEEFMDMVNEFLRRQQEVAYG